MFVSVRATVPATIFRITVVVAGLVLATSAHVAAQTSGTDVVEVTNGDRFTGDVSRLQRGDLSFSTPSAGTISINWTDVVRLTSTQMLDVELASGERFIGTLSSPSAGQLVVTPAPGSVGAAGPSRTIDMAAVVRITPIGLDFVARTTGAIDFGITFTQANEATAYALVAEAANRTRQYETEAGINSWLSRRSDAATLSRNRFELDVRRLLPNRWYAFGLFEAQQDDELDLDWRVLVGGGAGRRLVQSNEMFLAVEGGIDYDAERYAGAGSTDHAAEIFGGVEWDWFGLSGTDVAAMAKTYFSLARPRMRLELEADLRRDMAWSLHWALNVFESFDSDPPADQRRSNLGLSLGLGWSF